MSGGRSLLRLDQIRERFTKSMNIKAALDRSGHGFQFRLPGFAYDDFDRSGQLSPAKLNRFMESFRFIQMGSFVLENSTSIFYLLGSHITFSREVYARASLRLPLLIYCRPVRVGKSSLDMLHTLSVDRSDAAATTAAAAVDSCKFVHSCETDFLASRLLRVVALDTKSRRPKDITGEEREKLMDAVAAADRNAIGADFPQVDMPREAPPEAFSFEFHPRYSDMDIYFHVNQGAYLQYASDCASRASLAGKLPSFTDDVCFRNVATATNLYSAETFPTDKLRVSVWEDGEDGNVLCFVVFRGKELIYRSRFKYHPA